METGTVNKMQLNENGHFFYVLECSDGSYYAGYTVNVHSRIQKHNEGKGAKYTRGRTPVSLVYVEKLPTKGDALRKEIEFKRFSRAKKEQYIKRGEGMC